MIIRALLFVFAVGTAFVVMAVEGFQVFAFWNLTPLIAAAAIAVFLLGLPLSVRARIAAITFCIVSTATALYFHLALHFDWQETATGSSTASLIVIFIPPVSVVAGCVAALVALVLSDFAARRRNSGK